VNADRLAITWARLYTRGLPPDVAERRREELVSDLHEHASLQGRSPAQQREVVGRVLWGIPADLSWRRAARAHERARLESGAPMTLRKVTHALFAVYVLFDVWAAIGIFANPDGDYLPYASGMFAAAVCIALGLRGRDEAPRRSTVLLAVGAVLPAVTLFWMAIIFGPVAVGLIALAIATEPGRREPDPLLAA